MSEFLAEAAVLVRANTAGFRAALLAEVEASVRAAEAIAQVRITPVVTSAIDTGAKAGAAEQAAASRTAAASITEQTVATESLVLAQNEQVASATRAGIANQRLNAASKEQIAISTAIASATKKVSLAQEEIVGASSAAAAAQIHFTRTQASSAAVSAAAQKIANQAFIQGDAAAFALAQQMRILAVAEEQEALAALNSARSHTAQAAGFSQASRGAGSTLLTMLGLRGATLAATGPFIAAAAGALLFAKAIKTAADFSRELSVLQVTAGATADEMAAVGEEARKLGRDVSLPAVSAVDAAQAMTELSKAGLSVQDSLKGARGVLQLAAAAQIDNATATELAASALNAFGLAGDQAVHVADVLTNAANDAQGSISDMGASLQQAAAVGRQAGLSLEQTTAILTLFARNGLRGSDAGTSFRTMLIRLINPTQKASELMKKLGLSLRDANGAINLDVFDQFTQATKNFTKAERDRDLAIIFGQDAIRGASIVAREGTAAINAQVDSLNKSGAAAELAGARAKGLAGEASALQSNLETLALTIGSVLNPALEGLVKFLNNSVSALNIGTDAVGRFFGALKGAGEFDAANANFAELTQALAQAQEDLRRFRESGGKQAPALESDIAGLAKRVRDISAALNEVGPGGVQKMLSGFKAASPQIEQALQDGIITPLERAQLSSTALGKAFVSSLPKRFFVGLGADVRSGIEDATAQAKEGVADLGSEVASRIEDQSRLAVIGARNFGNNVGNALKDGIKTAFFAAVAAASAGAQRLNDAMNKAVIAGAGPQQIIPILKQQFDEQQKRIDAANARLAELQGAGDSPQTKQARARARKERSDALAEQARITGQVQSQNEQIASDAEKAASEREQRARDVKAANDKADQAFIDSLEPRRATLDRLMTVAEGTAGEADNRRILIALKKRAFAEIDLIDQHVKDKKLAAQLIEARRKEIVGLDNQIADATQAIADSANETARKNADALTESLGKAITLAGLRENDKAQVQAINKAIANARLRIKNYKKLGLNLQDEQIALETLINQRDEILNTAKDAKGGGTTAFDLLKQFSDTFKQNAGNLIGPNQPFAGPTGFTADIAQFLVRRPGVKQTTATAAAAKTPIELNDDRLVRSMDRLADVIERSGNRSSGVGTTVTRTGHGLGRQFVDSNQVRQSIEARSGI